MKTLKDMTLEELWELFPVLLKEHNPEYGKWYEEEQNALTHLLTSHDVFRISHIGSTAVKGLIAKPTVDILLELPEGYDRKTVMQTLQTAGWIVMATDHRTSTIDLNKGYTPNGFAKKVFHLHIKPAGDWGELYFRDYLQTHPDVARQYESLKLALKEKFEHNRDAYTNAKSDFIQQYTQIAREAFEHRYKPDQARPQALQQH